jgi:molybdenum cofactor cytidylyltransferase
VSAIAVVLAAGLGSRFRGRQHKLTSLLLEKPLWQWAIEHALDGGLDEVAIVTGAVDLPLAHLDAAVTVLENPRFASGQASSIRVALDHATRAGHDAVVVGLADQPCIPAEAWRRVAAARSTPIATASYRDRRAHPVRLGAEVWPLVPETGDEGARSLLRARPELVTEVPCPGDPIDVDAIDDLTTAEEVARRWNL